MQNTKCLFFQMFGLCAEDCRGIRGWYCLQQNTRNTEDTERYDFLEKHAEWSSKMKILGSKHEEFFFSLLLNQNTSLLGSLGLYWCKNEERHGGFFCKANTLVQYTQKWKMKQAKTTSRFKRIDFYNYSFQKLQLKSIPTKKKYVAKVIKLP